MRKEKCIFHWQQFHLLAISIRPPHTSFHSHSQMCRTKKKWHSIRMFNIDIGKGIAVYIFPLILVHFDISKSKLEIQSFQMDSRHLYFIYRTHNTQSIILYSHKISHRLFLLACSHNSTMYAYKQSKMRLNFFFLSLLIETTPKL